MYLFCCAQMEMNAHDRAVARALQLRRELNPQQQRDRNDKDRDAHYHVPTQKPHREPWTRKPPGLQIPPEK